MVAKAHFVCVWFWAPVIFSVVASCVTKDTRRERQFFTRCQDVEIELRDHAWLGSNEFKWQWSVWLASLIVISTEVWWSRPLNFLYSTNCAGPSTPCKYLGATYKCDKKLLS